MHGGCPEHSLRAHSSDLWSRTWGRAARRVPRQTQGLHRSLYTSQEPPGPLPAPDPAPSSSSPMVPTRPLGGAAVALSLPKAHLLSFPARPEVLGLQCGLAIPPLPADAAAHAPTAPSPRARVTAAWTLESWPGVRTGRDLYLARNPDPEYPRKRGPVASRAALERAAAPYQPPGPRSPSLGPEKRRRNFGRNFANFAFGEGEAARMARPAAGQEARGGRPARPGHPVRPGQSCPAGPWLPDSVPASSPSGPSPWVSKQPALRSAQNGLDWETWRSAQVRICPLPPWICLPGGAPSSSILGDENVVLLDAEARSG
ncbi:uncharacterized protein [Vicugna pacos]|uniref:Uncharacterized protein isoform X2 n=1 Tax=Vicugna pacos TaxID=30538 RepID=A0ABM5DRE6_VICPA